MGFSMTISLTQAPFDRPLILSDIIDSELETLLSRLGLVRGHAFSRENEEVLQHPVRVRTISDDVVIGGGMAMRVIVHLEDGRRLPLTDMTTGQCGHIEGSVGSTHLSEAMTILGLQEGKTITYRRQLPSMDYTVLIDKKQRQRIPEGMAAKIWGRIGDRHLQFVSAGKDQPFRIEKILGARRSMEALAEKGILPGRIITLEAVAPAQIITMAVHNPVVITTDDGLHLHLSAGQAEQILVETVNR
jgi:Fe2+ transport system protein FeoA